jgi:hypothetical protein
MLTLNYLTDRPKECGRFVEHPSISGRELMELLNTGKWRVVASSYNYHPMAQNQWNVILEDVSVREE